MHGKFDGDNLDEELMVFKTNSCCADFYLKFYSKNSEALQKYCALVC